MACHGGGRAQNPGLSMWSSWRWDGLVHEYFGLPLSLIILQLLLTFDVRRSQRVPGSCGSQISGQAAHEGGKVVSPTHRPPLPPRDIPSTHFY